MLCSTVGESGLVFGSFCSAGLCAVTIKQESILVDGASCSARLALQCVTQSVGSASM